MNCLLKTTETDRLRAEDFGIGRSDWRQMAMRAALATQANDGTSHYTILQALTLHRPDCCQRYFSEHRGRTLNALAERLNDFRPMLPGATRGKADAPAQRIYGWWSGVTEDGDTLEIILSPCHYGSGDWIVAGANAERVESFVTGIMAEVHQHTTRCLRFSSSRWVDAPEIEREVAEVNWDDIVLAPSLVADVRAAAEGFFQQRELYHRFGFPWRRGLLLVGPPGTGKTMLTKALAGANPEVRFLYVRDLKLGDEEDDVLTTLFLGARRLAPCLLVIEDMDGLIGPNNRTTFLNELDGFTSNDGILIVASSNHPERIDEALMKRPSRFDRVYHIGLPETPERARYVRLLLDRLPVPREEIDAEAITQRVAAATAGFTPAFLKEAVLSALLHRVQNGNTSVGPEFGDEILAQVQTLRNYLKKADNPALLSENVGSASGGDIGFRSAGR